MADPKSETGKERMRIMSETTDGFELSEKDLELEALATSLARNKAECLNLKWQIWFMTIERLKPLEKMRQSSCSLKPFGQTLNTKELRQTLVDSGVLGGDKLS